MHDNNLNIDEKIKHAIELFKAGEDVQSLLNEINNSDELITWVYEYEGISLAEWFMYIRALPEFFYGDDDPREYYGDDFFKDFDTPQKKLNWIKDQASIYKECGCSLEFNDINVFDWHTQSRLGRDLFLTDEDYLCPKCQKFSLSFFSVGCWD